MWGMVMDCVLQSSAGDHHTCVCWGMDSVKTIILPVAGIHNVAGIVIKVNIVVGCRGIVHAQGGWMVICVEFVNRVVAKANKANVCGDWGEPNGFKDINSIEICDTMGWITG